MLLIYSRIPVHWFAAFHPFIFFTYAFTYYVTDYCLMLALLFFYRNSSWWRSKQNREKKYTQIIEHLNENGLRGSVEQEKRDPMIGKWDNEHKEEKKKTITPHSSAIHFQEGSNFLVWMLMISYSPAISLHQTVLQAKGMIWGKELSKWISFTF